MFLVVPWLYYSDADRSSDPHAGLAEPAPRRPLAAAAIKSTAPTHRQPHCVCCVHPPIPPKHSQPASDSIPTAPIHRNPNPPQKLPESSRVSDPTRGSSARPMAPTAAAAAAKQQHSGKAVGLAALDASGHLAPLTITRRSTGDDDVAIKILYCGICHSDLHSIKNEWHITMYPIVPGHEIAGVVTEVGKNVSKFKAGDRVGVGCMVNSCQSCDLCTDGFENLCNGIIFTYNSMDRDGSVSYGGYSSNVVVHERFVVQFPDAMPLDQGAPLLCAGITVYSPMKYHGLNAPGKHVGVVGLGGLGHVAVKFAKAFGTKVTVISSSPEKRQEALERLGADAFVVSKNADEMKAAASTMDGIINTVSANIPVAPFVGLLKPNGKMIMVGLPDKSLEVPPFDLILGNKTLAGSCIGGMRDTQEMIDLAAKYGVTADVEVVGADYVNTAMERLAKADVRYRFVIDIANTLKSSE